MNTLQRFLLALSNTVEAGQRSPSQSLAVQPLKVRRRLSPNDRIVYLEESNQTDVSFCRISLAKMFSREWFDICVVRDAAELLQVSMFNTGKTFERLRMLHCVHWSQMPADIREQIPDMISEIFTEGAYPGDLGDVVSSQ